MKKEFVILYCTHCKQHYNYNDDVVVDRWKRVLHATCYQALTEFDIIERGTFKEIVNKHWYFKDLR